MAEMRMAELARRSGLPVATLKFYLREGLLEPGRSTSVNQAVYGEQHLERLRLIRALSKVAGLPLQKIREVVQAVSGETSMIDALGVTQDALVGEFEAASADSTTNEEAAALLDRVISERKWECQPGSPAHTAAVHAISDLMAEDLTILLDRLDDYAQAAEAVGQADVDAISNAENLESMIRGVVLGTVLRRPVLDALILLAQQHFAQRLNPSALDVK